MCLPPGTNRAAKIAAILRKRAANTGLVFDEALERQMLSAADEIEGLIEALGNSQRRCMDHATAIYELSLAAPSVSDDVIP